MSMGFFGQNASLMQGRRWLIYATGLLWLPLVMAGGSWLLVRTVAAPLLIAYLGLFCLESGKNLFETKAVSYVYSMNRRPYPSDVSDEEWAFVMPYLTLLSGRKPAKIPPAGSVQRPALAGKNRCPVGVPAPRLPPTPHRS